MIARLGIHGARTDPGRDDQRRDPRAKHGEIERSRLPVQQRPLHPAHRADLTARAGHTGRRRDMIVETAVLVVGDHQQGLVERRIESDGQKHRYFRTLTLPRIDTGPKYRE